MATIARTRPAMSKRRRRALLGYLYISPWLVGFLVFLLGPMVASLWLSFTDYTITAAPQFVGLTNYQYMLTRDPLFWGAVRKTAYFAVTVVVLSLAGSLGCAMLLNTGLRGATFYRTAFFIPSLTPIVATAVIWTWILQPTYGPLNQLLRSAGLPAPGWLQSPTAAIPGLAIIRLWVIIGGTQMIVFLAGLQGVPQELYEAARVDGASRWDQFRNVTLPMLSPTIFFNLVVGIIGALKVFALAFVATEGGPAGATWFYILHLYTTAFSNLELGYASALAWFFFLIVLLITLIQNRVSKRWVHYG